MDKILKNMDVEKRNRILNSAFKEFSKNGFKKASTNNIVQSAGISKGLLFHYFANKKALYNHLEKFSMETVLNNITDSIDWDESDFFKRILQIAINKIQITRQYPYIYEFMLSSMDNMSFEEINEYRETKSPGLLEKVYTHNIDYTKFKDNMDINKIIRIIQWSFEGYSKDLIAEIQKTNKDVNYKEMINEFENLIDILKKAFYK